MEGKLRPQGKQILKVLLEHDYSLSTTKVAKEAGVSWNTAEKYLKRFHKKNWIEQTNIGRKKLWRTYGI